MEILLRPLCIQDAVPLAKMADNENVHRYLRDRFPSPYLPEHALSFIDAGAAWDVPAVQPHREPGGFL